MTIEQSYLLGFIKRAAFHGFAKDEAVELLKHANPMAESYDNTDKAVHGAQMAHDAATLAKEAPSAVRTGINLIKTIPNLPSIVSGAKGLASTALKPKNIPGANLAFGAAQTGNYLRKGDLDAAGLSSLSTVAGALPGGVAASVPLDMYNANRHSSFMNEPVANPAYKRPVITEDNPITPSNNPYSNLPHSTVPRKDLLNVDSQTFKSPSVKPQARVPFQG
jgi:hypothetical protein